VTHLRFGLAALALLSLAACSTPDPRLPNLVNAVSTANFSTSSADPLQHAVAAGEISGGSSALFNQLGITDKMFREVLTKTLDKSGLLADAGSAKWQINCALDFDTNLALIGDQTVTAKIKYSLRDKRTGAIVFDKEEDSSSTKETTESTGLVALVVVLAGANAATMPAQTRRKAAYDDAVKDNLSAVLADLSQWDSMR